MQLRNKASKLRGTNKTVRPPSDLRSAARKQRRPRVGETSSWDHEAAAATAYLEAADDDEALSWSQPPTRRDPARGGERDGVGTERRHDDQDD